ncbi:hypothetical protein CSUB8523_0687 [Campylobacter subantarcticus LMG 24377]|uniref:Uncharacterized protein n=1 Tax=Campylobacter subantarcticus TaxID=497724 RepID=A0ABW9N4T6_9BACT|nr:hypothetical protein [Campylobacter subantarcticus]AJC92211.1 hypothetical protein CSUB8523_0687 [Campylobacter subantarcticus LMG 24377]EAL3938362.1 hypothetical protein [Campylobacter lari]MPB99291.1 hypothetical protein [Campylobacter subantarcticus]
MSSRDFLKIPNENGEFNIIVKRFSYERENYDRNNAFDQILGRYETYYFQPCFRVDYNSDKIIRKDILWEKESVLGSKSKGFAIASEDDFKEYCRKEFNEFRETLCLNPFSNKKEPEYSDDYICSLEAHLF